MTAGWSTALDNKFSTPFAQEFKLVLLGGDNLQGVFGGHIFREVPPPPALSALEPVVFVKTFPSAAISEVLAVRFLSVFGYFAPQALDLFRHIRPGYTHPTAPGASIP